MIGVVIPAHDEAHHIGATVQAVMQAAAHPGLADEAVTVLVVLDSCTDATGVIAAGLGAETLSLCARNVGMSRSAGAEAMLACGARWLAFTDGDTLVPPRWLVDQLAQGADAVCGPVEVDDWTPHGAHGEFLREHFENTYTKVEGHRFIHGANLGVSAEAYRRAGGFPPLACSEDVALVRALQATGARVVWSTAARVITSARTDARARGGFGDTLLAVVAARLLSLQQPASA